MKEIAAAFPGMDQATIAAIQAAGEAGAAYSLALPLTRAALESLQLSKPVVENVAMLVGTVLFMVINYLGQKFYAFKSH